MEKAFFAFFLHGSVILFIQLLNVPISMFDLAPVSLSHSFYLSLYLSRHANVPLPFAPGAGEKR